MDAPERKGAERKHAILVVDDEILVRKLVASLFEASGYVVHTAGNGQEAMAIFRKHASDVALLVTDVEMPNQNGIELTRELQAIKPQLRVVFMSGTLDDWEAQPGTAYVAKPFQIATLLREVEKQLKLTKTGD